MGMFGQRLKKSGRDSSSPQPNENAARPLTPVKLNASPSSIQGSNTKKGFWSHRSWNPLKQQPKPSTTPKSRQIRPSAFFNDDVFIVPNTEEMWNSDNDDEVALLATHIPSFIEPLFSPSDEEMFQVVSPLSASSFVSSSSPSYSSHQSTSTPNMSTEKVPPMWKRVSMLKRNISLQKEKPNTSTDKKHNKEEIEIQFECFFEEDEENWENELNFRTRNDDSKTPSKASLFRRTTVMQSWWTQTLGTVKRGCRMVPPSRPHPERSLTPGTAPLVHSDEESQEQIRFENVCRNGATSHSHEYDDSSSEEDNCTIHHRNMFVKAPIQFHIPCKEEPSSWEENQSFHHINYFRATDPDSSSSDLAFV